MTNGAIAERALRHRRYTELFARAMTEPDERKRAAILAELQRMVDQRRHRSNKREHQDA